jgi:hypothetical protein
MRENIIAVVVVALLIPAAYFGWLGVQTLFKTADPNEIISVTVTLDNRCDFSDKVFVISSLNSVRTYRFQKGEAILKLPRKTKLMLAVSNDYPGFEYSDVPKKVESNMTMVADCSVSPRLRSTLDAMKEQFNND